MMDLDNINKRLEVKTKHQILIKPQNPIILEPLLSPFSTKLNNGFSVENAHHFEKLKNQNPYPNLNPIKKKIVSACGEGTRTFWAHQQI
jgi:hypothetical protein